MKFINLCLFILLLYTSSATSGCSPAPAAILLKEAIVDTSYQTVASDSQLENDSVLASPMLDDYILLALKNSAMLKAAYLEYQAAQEKAPQVSSLPDPVLSYGYFIQEVQTRVGPQEHKIGLMQPIPWFGKLRLKELIADEEARATMYAFLAKKNQLVAHVTSAYFELAYLENAIQVTEANFELLKRWEQILTQRYRSQSGTQANLIKVQVELGKLEDKTQELSELKTPLTARLNSLLNRKSNSPVFVQPDAATRSPLLPKNITFRSLANLESILSTHNPDLLFFEALRAAKKNGVELAHKNFYPDFGIGADYIFVGNQGMAGTDSGDNALVGMFSITIPLYRSKYKASLAQAEKERATVEQMQRATYFELSANLARVRFETNDSNRRVALFRDTLIPKAEESLETTFTAFESGEATFLELLDTEREYLDFQLSLARAQADLHISSSKLLALLGDYSELNFSDETKGETK